MGFVLVILITVACMWSYLAIGLAFGPVAAFLSIAVTVPFLVIRLLKWDKERIAKKKAKRQGGANVAF